MISKFTRICGITNMICAILLFLSWFSIGIFMWDEISNQNFSAMVQNSAWIPVNIFYLIATVLLLPGIIGLYLQQSEKFGNWGLIAFFVTIIAILWYTCIQFYETFFWPLIATESPSLFKAVGFSPSNKLIYTQLMLSAIPWAVGYILLGIFTYRSNWIAKWAVIIFTLGALLFGIGMAFPIRTLGVILFCIGLIKYGIVLKSGISK